MNWGWYGYNNENEYNILYTIHIDDYYFNCDRYVAKEY